MTFTFFTPGTQRTNGGIVTSGGGSRRDRAWIDIEAARARVYEAVSRIILRTAITAGYCSHGPVTDNIDMSH